MLPSSGLMLPCIGNPSAGLSVSLELTENIVPPHDGPPKCSTCGGFAGWRAGAACFPSLLFYPLANARRMSVHPADRRSARHAATHAVCAGASRDLQSGVRFKPGERLRGLGIRRFDAGGYTLRPHTDHHARGGADVNALKDVRPMQFRVIAQRSVSVKRGSRFAKREF